MHQALRKRSEYRHKLNRIITVIDSLVRELDSKPFFKKVTL